MKFLQSELSKLILYLLASFILAALWTPWLYSWGKDLADFTASNETFAALEWLGEKAERAKFDRYFKRALMVTAVVLLWPLIRSLRAGSSRKRTVLLPLKRGATWRDMVAGLLMAAGVFAVLAVVVVWKGNFVIRQEVDWLKICLAALPVAVVVSLIEEYLFRGVLYGVLARSMGAAQTIFWSSLLFAVVHFTQPPKGMALLGPGEWDSGLRFLWMSITQLFSLSNVVSSFSCILMVGIVLAVARYKTAGLAVAIGLHTGWIVVYKVFTKATSANPEVERSILVGGSIRDGLLALSFLVITLGFVLHYAKRFYVEKER